MSRADLPPASTSDQVIPAGARPCRLTTAVATAASLLLAAAAAGLPAESERSGRELYRWACSSCHGVDGRGAPPSRVGFDVPLPDFTDCDFAAREPAADWVAVAHDGGPTRGFSELMPAFGGALTVAELERAVGHVRGFCDDARWPRGELNLPRALVTGKAYPEDEAVFVTTVATDHPGSVTAEVVYEQRFGARNQWEVVIPVGWRELDADGDGGWSSGLGDVAVAVKRVLWHDSNRGGIVSAAAEVLLPTGDRDRGFGSGTTVVEPFLAWGQILPRGLFLQAQAGLGLPISSDRVEEEAFARLAFGGSISRGRWGRTFSPMVEVLAARELTSGADTAWDLVPQVQVTLNTRQHIMANAGVRIPLDDRDSRSSAVIVYLLWDWFDGGLTEGW